MNVMISNVLSGSSASAVTGKGGASSPSQAADPFGQMLVHVLGGNIASGDQASAANPLNGAVGSLFSLTGGNGEEDMQWLIALILGMLQQTDGKVEQDKELLQQLQQWLAQANEVLAAMLAAGGQNIAEAETSGGAIELDLASHPETLRFAVQDALVQLAAIAQSGQHTARQTAAESNAPAAATQAQPHQAILTAASGEQAAQLIKSLQTLLKAAGIDGADHSAFVRHMMAANTAASGQTAQPLQMNMSSAAQQSQIAANQAAAGETLRADVQTVRPSGESADTGGQTVTAGQLSLRTGDHVQVKAPEAVNANNVPQDMTRFIVKQMSFAKLHGMSEAKISLYPEHLGQVDVKITLQNGQLVASFVTERAAARELLENQMVQLRAALQAQGLQVEKLEVTHNENLSSQLFQEQRQQHREQQASEQQNKKRGANVEEIESGFRFDMDEQAEADRIGDESSFTASA
ncbi:flagellar hook-length control protein FliK [Paenibacillus sp. MSJ-34]|uniref:flagellar hook-length control protein FliK n=1 Tax=Paenibacillus sp. MSJ-34 TaxID=2841529 RepID=UPI001C12187F|nr:flagellar hook-length control protein FliK [Paenibacillus sp. MSJ-34]MBU5441767.1 flagellar hook-length control protein FliK [Paenibacillus sp. MSJ-34]